MPNNIHPDDIEEAKEALRRFMQDDSGTLILPDSWEVKIISVDRYDTRSVVFRKPKPVRAIKKRRGEFIFLPCTWS